MEKIQVSSDSLRRKLARYHYLPAVGERIRGRKKKICRNHFQNSTENRSVRKGTSMSSSRERE